MALDASAHPKSVDVLVGGLMFGALGRIFRVPKEKPREVIEERIRREPERIPAELALAIETAAVFRRPDRDGEPQDPIVRIIGVGTFRYEGRQECADRIAYWDPEMTWQQCRRAARLIESRIAIRNAEHFAGRPSRARRWRKPRY